MGKWLCCLILTLVLFEGLQRSEASYWATGVVIGVLELAFLFRMVFIGDFIENFLLSPKEDNRNLTAVLNKLLTELVGAVEYLAGIDQEKPILREVEGGHQKLIHELPHQILG